MRLIDADKIGLTDFEIVMCEGSYKNALETLIYKISNAPTIDAMPVRHGKWIDRNGAIVEPFWKRYECSECGARSDNSKYCPHCGARMVKEEEDG